MQLEKDELQKKLARTVLAFQDSYLARENSPVGLLCQVRTRRSGAVNCRRDQERTGSRPISNFNGIFL